MATAINLGRQRLRPEYGIGGSLVYEQMALQAGVMALHASVPKPRKQEQAQSVEDVPVLDEEDLRALAASAVEAEVELVEV